MVLAKGADGQFRSTTSRHLGDHGVHHREVVRPQQPGGPPRRLQRVQEHEPGRGETQSNFS